MTLSFSTKWGKEMGELAGQPTYFVEKIWAGFLEQGMLGIDDFSNIHTDHINRFGRKIEHSGEPLVYPKLTTIRHDPKRRWKPGMNIHFVIYNRTKNRFQFAPVIEVESVQRIEIKPDANTNYVCEGKHTQYKGMVKVDGMMLSRKDVQTLATNDGFNSIDDFFRFFNTDFDGVIVHWTDLNY